MYRCTTSKLSGDVVSGQGGERGDCERYTMRTQLERRAREDTGGGRGEVGLNEKTVRPHL